MFPKGWWAGIILEILEARCGFFQMDISLSLFFNFSSAQYLLLSSTAAAAPPHHHHLLTKFSLALMFPLLPEPAAICPSSKNPERCCCCCYDVVSCQISRRIDSPLSSSVRQPLTSFIQHLKKKKKNASDDSAAHSPVSFIVSWPHNGFGHLKTFLRSYLSPFKLK